VHVGDHVANVQNSSSERVGISVRSKRIVFGRYQIQRYASDGTRIIVGRLFLVHFPIEAIEDFIAATAFDEYFQRLHAFDGHNAIRRAFLVFGSFGTRSAFVDACEGKQNRDRGKNDQRDR